MTEFKLTIEKQNITATRELKRYILLGNNEVVLYSFDVDMIQWLIDHSCKNTTPAGGIGIYYRFPSDEVKTWFILRWS